MQRLQEYLEGLENERRKVEAFQRELPLCMQLLEEAIQGTKERLAKQLSGKGQHSHLTLSRRKSEVSLEGREDLEARPNFEQHTALQNTEGSSISGIKQKNRGEVDDVPAAQREDEHRQHRVVDSPSRNKEMQEEQAGASSQPPGGVQGQPDVDLEVEAHPLPGLFPFQRPRGAFSPFARADRMDSFPLSPFRQADRPQGPATELSLGPGSFQGMESLALPFMHREKRGQGAEDGRSGPTDSSVLMANRSQGSDGPSDSTFGQGLRYGGAVQGPGSASAHRKTRRCWSPELHRRFVGALNQLGGSQVATPKQIREVMRVEGLTNDEVKSHLQKYRLHTRRPSPAPQSPTPAHAPPAPASQQPHLVLLGNIWMPAEYAAAAAGRQPAPALYDAAAAAVHSLPQYPHEFFSPLRQSPVAPPTAVYCDPHGPVPAPPHQAPTLRDLLPRTTGSPQQPLAGRGGKGLWQQVDSQNAQNQGEESRVLDAGGRKGDTGGCVAEGEDVDALRLRAEGGHKVEGQEPGEERNGPRHPGLQPHKRVRLKGGPGKEANQVGPDRQPILGWGRGGFGEAPCEGSKETQAD